MLFRNDITVLRFGVRDVLLRLGRCYVGGVSRAVEGFRGRNQMADRVDEFVVVPFNAAGQQVRVAVGDLSRWPVRQQPKNCGPVRTGEVAAQEIRLIGLHSHHGIELRVSGIDGRRAIAHAFDEFELRGLGCCELDAELGHDLLLVAFVHRGYRNHMRLHLTPGDRTKLAAVTDELDTKFVTSRCPSSGGCSPMA